MKKVVLKLDLHDDKEKCKAMKAVTSLSGIDSISMDVKDKKLTVIREVDPVDIVAKLRKKWDTDILSVGPAKEPEKKKDDDKKKDPSKQVPKLMKICMPHNPYMTTHHYVHSAEENPDACVIC